MPRPQSRSRTPCPLTFFFLAPPGRKYIDGVATEEPLFGPNFPPVAGSLVGGDTDMHVGSYGNMQNRPGNDDYLPFSFVPIVSAQYNRNPGLWARQEREILERQLALINSYRQGQFGRKASRPTQPRSHRSSRTKPIHEFYPKQHVIDAFDPSVALVSEPSHSSGGANHNIDCHVIQDNLPSLATPGSNSKALKAGWKGQMLDLEQ